MYKKIKKIELSSGYKIKRIKIKKIKKKGEMFIQTKKQIQDRKFKKVKSGIWKH